MSKGNNSYFLTFIDHATRYTWVYVIASKSDVFKTFVKWKVMVEKQYERKVKIIRTDNGGEYTSNEFESYLSNEGITHQKTIPKTPEQNGVAERFNRTIMETVRCLLSDSELEEEFWAEALMTATYIRNRCINSFLGNRTPFEALNNKRPSVKHFRVFGCTAYAHIPKDERSKLNKKARLCKFVGYGTVIKGYKLYDVESKKIFFSRNVIFDELNKFEKSTDSKPSSPPLVFLPGDSDQIADDTSDEQQSVHSDDSNENPPEVQNPEVPPVIPPEANIHKSTRQRKAPIRYGNWDYNYNSTDEDSLICEMNSSQYNEPRTVNEAMNGSESPQWKLAMERELKSFDKNNVFELVKRTPDMNLIKSRWVFKRKKGSDGEIVSYKARLVAQGFLQRPGIDYDETFAPVVRFESVRTVLSLAAKHKLLVHHLDFNSAFLNGELKEDVYMTLPIGYVNKGNENLVCKLNKSMYGLKQSPKCWNDALDEYLKSLGFDQSSCDSCIYVKLVDKSLCMISVYVDDIIVACKNLEDLENIKLDLSSKFELKDLGSLSYFLGIKVVQQDNNISLNQASYVESLLNRFDFSNCKPVATPADVNSHLEKATDDCDLVDSTKYMSAVGSLLYLSTKTRPDIAYAVYNVSKFCSKPNVKHWMAVKRIFRYLKGTPNLGINYGPNDSDLVGYSDADWAGDRNDRKSTSGHCFLLNNAIISWRSVKQSCVALSTAEAEYVSLSGAAQEAVFLSKLLVDFKMSSNEPVVIFEDNQSAICIAKNSKHHSKTKHIDIKFHYVRDLVTSNCIKVVHCPTEHMLADIFTKPLPIDRFKKLVQLIGMTYN